VTDPTDELDLGDAGGHLRKLGHDLRGMLGVLRLEGFSLAEIGADVRRAASDGRLEAAVAAVAELDEIAAELKEASARGTALADQVHRLGVRLEQAAEETDRLK